MFKDEGGNAVLHIESITYQCTGTVPILIRMVLNLHLDSHVRVTILTMRSPRAVIACVVASVLKLANWSLLPPRNVKPCLKVLSYACLVLPCAPISEWVVETVFDCNNKPTWTVVCVYVHVCMCV